MIGILTQITSTYMKQEAFLSCTCRVVIFTAFKKNSKKRDSTIFLSSLTTPIVNKSFDMSCLNLFVCNS